MVNILLVEDDRYVQALLCEGLEEAGHVVHVASNGREALNQLVLRGCDVVITDIYMPDGDGLELITKLRRLASAPVIAMSGGSPLDPALVMLGAAEVLGANQILQKPFTVAALLDAVERTLHPPPAVPSMPPPSLPMAG